MGGLIVHKARIVKESCPKCNLNIKEFDLTKDVCFRCTLMKKGELD